MCIGNSMICSDIWKLFYVNLRQFWNIKSGIYAKYHVQIMLLFVFPTQKVNFVIFTCKYFKLSWNTIALSQSSCRNFSCSSIIHIIIKPTKGALILYCRCIAVLALRCLPLPWQRIVKAKWRVINKTNVANWLVLMNGMLLCLDK